MGYNTGGAPDQFTVDVTPYMARLNEATARGERPVRWVVGHERYWAMLRIAGALHCDPFSALFGLPVDVVRGDGVELVTEPRPATGPTVRLHGCPPSPEGASFCIYCGVSL